MSIDLIPNCVLRKILELLTISDKANFAKTCQKYLIFLPSDEILKKRYNTMYFVFKSSLQKVRQYF